MVHLLPILWLCKYLYFLIFFLPSCPSTSVSVFFLCELCAIFMQYTHTHTHTHTHSHLHTPCNLNNISWVVIAQWVMTEWQPTASFSLSPLTLTLASYMNDGVTITENAWLWFLLPWELHMIQCTEWTAACSVPADSGVLSGITQTAGISSCS